ncbi:branched-chain-amino-acid aminotransferase, cytosolic-like [Clavelina lepadiformis]|uniref:branched-chain-amino-acid aminotransferase, cytosolic-like n=1 Tax=Clavelina lepadiformis TaxID=159417 RepID=UPI004042BB47
MAYTWMKAVQILKFSKSTPFALVQQCMAHRDSFKASEIEYHYTSNPKPKPANSDFCKFGTNFTDHMLMVDWDDVKGWEIPVIKPIEDVGLHPAASVLQFSTELYEGLKAYRTARNRINIFRPMENMKRMKYTAERACLPVFDKQEVINCICELVRVDKEWVPYSQKASLYIRPFMIGTEISLALKRPNTAKFLCIMCPVGPYFATGTFSPISLLADPSYVRAGKGGVGAYKLGSNYGPTIMVQAEAASRGCQQVLWLYGKEEKITEVGTMNFFMFWINENGDKELATMPLDEGIVLSGVTRRSLIDLARQWGEFKVTERKITMNDVVMGLNENRVLEMFGTGTACVVCPIDRILYKDTNLHIPTMENGPYVAGRFYKELADIQYGRVSHEWAYTTVEEY